MFGFSEPFNDLQYERDPATDFVCFTDDRGLRSDFWSIRYVPRESAHPARVSKGIKLRPHRHLAEYDTSLYVDNRVRLRLPPREIFERFLEPARSPLVCFTHPWRQCVYDEAKAVVAAELDDPERVRAQMAFYRELGYPRGNGLAASGFLLRRHGNPAVVEVMETWFEHLQAYSLRDQLSFPVASWLHGFAPEHLPFDLKNNGIMEWPYPKNAVRLPRNFSDAQYLALHPDVRAAGIDPRQHYLLHGLKEGRTYNDRGDTYVSSPPLTSPPVPGRSQRSRSATPQPDRAAASD